MVRVRYVAFRGDFPLGAALFLCSASMIPEIRLFVNILPGQFGRIRHK